jgi:hypothetical protein
VQGVDPTAAVNVDRAAGRVRIENAQADPAALRRAIEDEGYEVAQPAGPFQQQEEAPCSGAASVPWWSWPAPWA